MKKKFKYWIVFWGIFALASCTYDFPETELPSEKDLGEINTDNIVAIGDGFLSGVMDGALYTDGQDNSLASIIVTQIKAIADVKFNRASIDSENGYNFYATDADNIFGKWIYRYSGYYEEEPQLTLTVGENVQDYTGDKIQLHDYTVPLLRVYELYNDLSENIFYSRVSANSTTSLVQQIIERSPSFIVCWIGMNDYLLYAMNGATDENLLTSEQQFQENLEKVIGSFVDQTSAKIVIGNLIAIKDLPFFYYYQYNFIRLSNPEKGIAQARYRAYNEAVAAYNVGKPMDKWRPMISFEDNGATLYPQRLVVVDNSLPNTTYPDGTPLEKFRQLNENEMALFSIIPEMVQQGYGSRIPLTDSYYLSELQIEIINGRIRAFNQTIKNAALKLETPNFTSDFGFPIFTEN